MGMFGIRTSSSAFNSGTRWWWMLVAGAGIAFLMYMLMFALADVYLTVVSISARGQVKDTVIQPFARFAAIWLWPPLYLTLVTGVTAWMTRWFGTVSRWQGISVGLVSAVGWNAIGWAFAPPETYELIVYPLCGMAGGLLGIFLGRISIAGREALYRASRDVAAASSADEVASAIWRHLADSNVEQVSLWSVAPATEEGLSLDLTGSRNAGAEGLWPSGARLDERRMPALAGMRQQTPHVVRKRDMPAKEKKIWEQR
ncbi:MAG TPA: hypothetical protein VHM16_06130, partial [Rubrobacteraceae bacterium]|nr:hypothetical protein [Rubrobacteraceae bacterium]